MQGYTYRPDIRATFDDEASLEAQYACDQSSTPAISGSVIGGNPPNSALLASYDGRDIGGTWTLTIDDRDDLDDGTLNSWCLIAEVSSLEQGPLAAECEGFAPPFDARIGLGKKEQRVIPLRMEIFDENGFPLGLNDITAPTVSVSYSPGSNHGEIDPLIDSPGNATPGNSFRWDAATERWAFNLSTRPYTAAGTYTVTAVAGDGDYVLQDPTCTAPSCASDAPPPVAPVPSGAPQGSDMGRRGSSRRPCVLLTPARRLPWNFQEMPAEFHGFPPAARSAPLPVQLRLVTVHHRTVLFRRNRCDPSF